MKNLITTLFLLFSITFLYAQDAEKLFKTGEEKIESNDFKAAAKILSKAVKADPSNILYKYELAYAYYRMEKFKKAYNTIDPALKTVPEVTDSRKFLELLYKEMGVPFGYKMKEAPNRNLLLQKTLQTLPKNI